MNSTQSPYRLLPNQLSTCPTDTDPHVSYTLNTSCHAIATDSVSITNLPHELLVPIFDRLSHPADLVPSLLTCKSLHSSVRHSLYSRPIRLLTAARLHRFVSQLATSSSSPDTRGTGADNGSLVCRLELVIELQHLIDGQLSQLGALCPNLTHLTIHDAVVLRSNDSASESDDDVPEYEFDDGDINLSDTETSGPNPTRHLSPLFQLTTHLESLSLKQVKSLDLPDLLTLLASSCPRLHTLTISELNNACRPINVDRWSFDHSPPTLSITQSLATLQSLRTLILDDVESTVMSALLVQHLACPSLTSLSLCNNYHRRDTDFEAAFSGLFERHPRLVRLSVLDSKCDNDNIADEVVRAALQVWSGEQVGMTTRRMLEVGYYFCSKESREKVERVFGDRVVLR